MIRSTLYRKMFMIVCSFFWVVQFIQGQALLDPTVHSQFQNVITAPNVAVPNGNGVYVMQMQSFQKDCGLDNNQTTTMYGYKSQFPGPTIKADENVAIKVRYPNQLNGAHILPLDESIDWAAPPNYPASGVPAITHLHGGHNLPQFDGYPAAWYTPGPSPDLGTHYQGNGVKYYNDQDEATLWYHDNTEGVSRLNQYAGLSGFYLLEDHPWEQNLKLPSGDYDVPLHICDRSFFEDTGELFYPSFPAECYQPNASVHPHFYGDFNLVNGKVWPKMKVEPRKYRFRLLNAADSRFYNMSLDNPDLVFYLLGTDGGFINKVEKRDELLLAPGERYDVIIDFSGIPVGKEIIINNNAVTPYPNGAPVDAATSGRVMMFEIVPLTGPDYSQIPGGSLRQTPLTTPNIIGLPQRQVQMGLTFDNVGRLIPLLGTGQHGMAKFNNPISENPKAGVPEVWQFLNVVANSQPIHVNQQQFRPVHVRPFNVDIFDMTGVISYTGPPIPAINQKKDTYIVPFGHEALMTVEFDIEGLYHWGNTILSHRDFDSKRPMYVGDCSAPVIANNTPMEFFECGPVQPGKIGGFVWEDLNANGIKEPGEPGILNASVEIVSVPALNFVDQVFTDANGMYTFNNVAPATYYVVFANPGNYYPTLDNQGNDDMIDSDGFFNGSTDIVAISSGEVDMTIYNGYVPELNLAPVLDPIPHPKFVNPLTIPPILQPTSGNDYYEVDIVQFTADLGIVDPNNNAIYTEMYGYNGMYPGPTFNIKQNLPIKVKWNNMLPTGANGAHILPLDQSIHWARPSGYPASGVPIVSHLHGGHTDAESDGYPDAWYTPGNSPVTGSFFTGDTYKYSNDQDPTMLWYHDHAIGITRLNVNAGLAGAYMIRNSYEANLKLPSGNYEIPLILSDRSFREDGSLYFPAEPGECWVPNPSVIEEFTGDFNIVNGKVWPYLKVEPRKYRFRVLNGADSRFYRMALSNGMNFYQIGSDGGFLDVPLTLNELLLAPAERADLIIDFSGVAVGTNIVLTNTAQAPFPMGGPPDPNTAGQIMQFTVVPLNGPDNSVIPPTLQPTPITPINVTGAPHRLLTLTIGADQYGRLKPLQGTHEEGALAWGAPITENPQIGVPEVWEIINLTPDVHPIHLHQIFFQAIERQPFNDALYDATGVIEFTGPPEPLPLEWKDTYQADPAFITRIAVEFDLEGIYVWHCHILSHEDHDMMRPMYIGDCSNPQLPSGASVKFMDCGNTGAMADIKGVVWEDLNCDGIRDPGEPGIANDYVEINEGFGFFTDNTYTDANGVYYFNVPAGVYTITMGNPGAYFVSPKDQGANDNIDSDLLFAGTTEPFAVSAGSSTDHIWGGFMTCDPMMLCDIAATYTTTCDVNGTPNDPSDDLYYIHLTVTGSGSNGWASSNTGYSGQFGVPVTVGPLSIADGGYNIVIVDQEDQCCKTMISITPPDPCSNNCDLTYDFYTECYDNGTPFDPTDDVFYIKFAAFGGPSAGYVTSNGYSNNYGDAVWMGPFPIANGPVNFIVFDSQDPGCNLAIQIDPPATCSQDCNISYDYDVRCFDNNTPNDPSDDYFHIKLGAFGGPGTSWTSSLGIGATYGNAATAGPFLISNGDLYFTITDVQYPGCSIPAFIPAPAPCSDNCNLTYDYYTWCDNNGTPADPSDDVFFLKIAGLGGPSAGWQTSNGLTANYGDSDIGGPYLIAGGDLNITMSDIMYPGCQIQITIPAPAPCSDLCNLIYDTYVECNDQGTSDPNDDTFYFKIKVVGGPSAGWTSNIGLSGAYGATVVGGPYLASGGGFTFTVMDSQFPGCNINVTIDVPTNCGPMTVTSTAPDAGLSVTSINLSIAKDITSANLSWKSTVSNVKNFNVLRSVDGFNFEQIGSVTANSKTGNFFFIDKDPGSGFNYYQIAFNDDVNGLKSNIVNAVFAENIAVQKKAKVVLYPNPAEHSVNIDLSSFEGAHVWVIFLDQIGRQVMSFEIDNVTNNLINKELSSLANGYYNVVIKTDEGLIATEKLIVMKR